MQLMILPMADILGSNSIYLHSPLRGKIWLWRFDEDVSGDCTEGLTIDTNKIVPAIEILWDLNHRICGIYVVSLNFLSIFQFYNISHTRQKVWRNQLFIYFTFYLEIRSICARSGFMKEMPDEIKSKCLWDKQFSYIFDFYSQLEMWFRVRLGATRIHIILCWTRISRKPERNVFFLCLARNSISRLNEFSFSLCVHFLPCFCINHDCNGIWCCRDLSHALKQFFSTFE